MTENMIDREQVQNALCLYEAMLDGREKHAPLNDLWDQIGSYEMRDVAVALAQPCDDLWHKLDNEGDGDNCDGLAWDFEFLPELIEHIDWLRGEVGLKPDAEDKMREYLKAHRRQMEVGDWDMKAVRQADKLYGYGGMVREYPEWFARAYHEGQTPEAAVKEFGDKYDLSEVDPVWRA